MRKRVLIEITLIFWLVLFISLSLHIVSVQGRTGLKEGQEFRFELVQYEFQSIHQNSQALPIFSSRGNLVAEIQPGEVFSVKSERILNSGNNLAMVVYQISNRGSTNISDESLNLKIWNTDIFSIDLFHTSYSDSLNKNVILPYINLLEKNIFQVVNTTGEVLLINTDDEFGIRYSSYYFSNDTSNQTLNVVWEYQFDKETGVLRKYIYQLVQNIVVYGEKGPAYRDIASRNIELLRLDDSENKIIFPSEILIGILITILVFASYLTYQRLTPGTITEPNKIVNNQITQIVKEVFGDYSKSYFLIGQNFVKRENIDQEATEAIPQELLQYKFLMNPVRLSIAKLLMENITMTLSDLRIHLGISWGELSTNTKAMESKGYIVIEDKIVNDTVKKTASLDPLGITEFEKLINLLINFIDQSPLYDKYIDNALKISKEGKN